MANIYEMLGNQAEKGFNLIDTDGTFCKGEKVKKEAYKAYNKGVQSGEIDPCEYDFKSYFDWYTGANFIELNSIIEDIRVSVKLATDNDNEIETEEEQEG